MSEFSLTAVTQTTCYCCQTSDHVMIHRHLLQNLSVMALDSSLPQTNTSQQTINRSTNTVI